MTLRRAVDIAVGLGGLVLALPVMAVVAAYLRVTAGSPVLFVQRRATLRGRTFRLRKFRTMNTHREADGRLRPDAQRLVRGGKFLRATRLDELPQLWHVLVGDMSLIGPRPLLPETIEEAGSIGVARGLVRPGLTGWAQVNGNTRLSDSEKFALDLWYARNRTLRLDLRILVQTLLVAVRGERRNPVAIRRAHAGDHRRRG
ncbi:sugar transferase [Sphingomonas aerophila]|uniref:Lipopolysaccharide/colanic/teichoic acid biosynthesis glycosyltransferase n=1 Tax=Sphingomonas aerophila TaxID=1344948 RepID=A0A7W9BBQ2_9SPHN|nr:lipopolysaccharide/colanic/teichoic acid biosynthesis glycosyltransferase [Sphingomonas aerophila]